MITQALNAASKKLDEKRHKYSASIKARATSKPSEKAQTNMNRRSQSLNLMPTAMPQSSDWAALPSLLTTAKDNSHASSVVMTMSDSPSLSRLGPAERSLKESSLISVTNLPLSPETSGLMYTESFGSLSSLGSNNGYTSSSSSSTDVTGSTAPSSNRSSMSSNRSSVPDASSLTSRLWSKRDSGYESSSARSSEYMPAYNGLSRNDSGVPQFHDPLSSTPPTSGASSPISISGALCLDHTSPCSSYNRRRNSNPSKRNSLLEPFSPPPVTTVAATQTPGIPTTGSRLFTICADPEEHVLSSSYKSDPALATLKKGDAPSTAVLSQEGCQTGTDALDNTRPRDSLESNIDAVLRELIRDNMSSSTKAREIDSIGSSEKVAKGTVTLPVSGAVDPDNEEKKHQAHMSAHTTPAQNEATTSVEVDVLSRELGSLALEKLSEARRANTAASEGNTIPESKDDDACPQEVQNQSSGGGVRQHSSGYGSSGYQGYYSGADQMGQSFGGFGNDQFIPGDGSSPDENGDGEDDESEGRKSPPNPAKPKSKKQDLPRCPWPGCPWSKATHLKTHLRRKHFKPLKCPKSSCMQRFGDCWGIERHIRDRHRDMDPKTAGVPQTQSEVNHFQNRLISTTSTFTYQEQVAICKAKTRQQLMAISFQIRSRPELSDEAVEEWRRIVRESREGQRPQPSITLSPPEDINNHRETSHLPAINPEAYDMMRGVPEVSNVQASDSSRIVTAVKEIIKNSSHEMPDTDSETLHALDLLKRAFDYMSLSLSDGARAAHAGSLQPPIISPSISSSTESPGLSAVTDNSSPSLQGWEDYEGLLPPRTARTPSDSAYTSGSDPMMVDQNPPPIPYKYPRRPSVRVMAHQYSVAHALPPPPPLITPTQAAQPVIPKINKRHGMQYTFGPMEQFDGYGYH